ncbi:cupredoxin domain-containing protein [Acidihalobacter prosperus]|uniref:EfeO-type cupredoxin-like domain-containing protein n=1 Tax=Acidihalobacter prosperus TaxID=160660 RepID=A0A1A6C7J6_9GAMM|nr:cupredoxin domain-containing protein [Acidihalobacter prosperus]OBS10519.1 hypothetical protein Thpro_020235 [Acidihalobacter prosperus]
MNKRLPALALVTLALATGGASAAAPDSYKLVIEQHRFQPAEITVPANKRITLVIENRDATAEEFESHDLKREKIIPGHTTAKVRVGPLRAGQYRFFGEFHEDTAQGVLIVR